MRAVDVNHLPPEPTTLREAHASPEWPNWQRARKGKMDGHLARQVRRHHRGIRRQPPGGERNEVRRGAGHGRPTILLLNQGLKGGRVLSRMPHHAGPQRENAETRPTPLRADRGFEIQRREDAHHGGSSGSKTPVQRRCPKPEAETEKIRVTPYREAVGALMWAGTMTRPDVAYAAHQLGKLNDNLGPAHWRVAKKVIQYLWRTKDVGITYGRTPASCTKLSA